MRAVPIGSHTTRPARSLKQEAGERRGKGATQEPRDSTAPVPANALSSHRWACTPQRACHREHAHRQRFVPMVSSLAPSASSLHYSRQGSQQQVHPLRRRRFPFQPGKCHPHRRARGRRDWTGQALWMRKRAWYFRSPAQRSHFWGDKPPHKAKALFVKEHRRTWITHVHDGVAEAGALWRASNALPPQHERSNCAGRRRRGSRGLTS